MKIFHKILCLLDEHKPKDYCETEQGLKPNTIRNYRRCKYCNKRIQYHHCSDTWYSVKDEWLKGNIK